MQYIDNAKNSQMTQLKLQLELEWNELVEEVIQHQMKRIGMLLSLVYFQIIFLKYEM
jgi:hypothetical protein